MKRRTVSRSLVLLAAASIAVAACGSDDDSSSTTAGATTTAAATASTTAGTGAAGGAVDLASVCPETIVVQTDWFPESEHGALYELVGEGYKLDTEKKVLTGPLVVDGQPTGVNIEIRTGGPSGRSRPARTPAPLSRPPRICCSRRRPAGSTPCPPWPGAG